MIKILCIGNIKDKNLLNLINNYKLRISKYSKIEIIELKESKTDDINEETNNLKNHLTNKDYKILLDLKGKMLDSIELKDFIIDLYNYHSNKDITFIIGGSNGVSDIDVDYRLCLSKNTFPHQLIRLFLLEQIYRCFKIINNEPYHK